MRVCARVFISYVHGYTCALGLCLRCIHPTGKMQLTLSLGQNVRRNPIKFILFLNNTFFHNTFLSVISSNVSAKKNPGYKFNI